MENINRFYTKPSSGCPPTRSRWVGTGISAAYSMLDCRKCLLPTGGFPVRLSIR
jgi:hypothetical protein